MITTLSVTEAVRNFSECINRVMYKRDIIVLRKGKRIVAEIRPVVEGKTLGDLPDLIAALPRLSPDQTAAFANDLLEIRESISKEGLGDPWAS